MTSLMCSESAKLFEVKQQVWIDAPIKKIFSSFEGTTQMPPKKFIATNCPIQSHCVYSWEQYLFTSYEIRCTIWHCK